jgi:hypothetical protein
VPEMNAVDALTPVGAERADRWTVAVEGVSPVFELAPADVVLWHPDESPFAGAAELVLMLTSPEPDPCDDLRLRYLEQVRRYLDARGHHLAGSHGALTITAPDGEARTLRADDSVGWLADGEDREEAERRLVRLCGHAARERAFDGGRAARLRLARSWLGSWWPPSWPECGRRGRPVVAFIGREAPRTVRQAAVRARRSRSWPHPEFADFQHTRISYALLRRRAAACGRHDACEAAWTQATTAATAAWRAAGGPPVSSSSVLCSDVVAAAGRHAVLLTALSMVAHPDLYRLLLDWSRVAAFAAGQEVPETGVWYPPEASWLPRWVRSDRLPPPLDWLTRALEWVSPKRSELLGLPPKPVVRPLVRPLTWRMRLAWRSVRTLLLWAWATKCPISGEPLVDCRDETCFELDDHSCDCQDAWWW